jgi:hypothetical protein
MKHFPSGVEKRVYKSHKLDDYFDDVKLISTNNDLLLKVVFSVRQGVDSFWKYMMMEVLKSISDGLVGVSVTSIEST